jgi:hypothetical protein
MENTNEEDPQSVEIEVPLILPGFHVPERTYYQSRLVFPQGMENVNDEAFRIFGEEMREQYEILESDYNALKQEVRVMKSELIRNKNSTRIVEESYKQLLKKLLKVTMRDYPQFRFGDVVLDARLNCVLPVFNTNTNRFTNYSNNTRSFLDIVKSQAPQD